MALDFLKLADKNLGKVYNAKPAVDQTPKRRTKVIEGIDRMLAALKRGEAKPARGWYNVRGDTAKLQLKHGNKALSINGESEFFVPRERAADWYAGAKASVLAGELDSSITDAVEGNVRASATSGDRTVKQRAKRGPMSPEKLAARNAKRAATLAAKKAQ